MDSSSYWFNFFWLVAYFLVLVGMSGYGFHRLLMVALYIKHRKDIPQPKEQWGHTADTPSTVPGYVTRWGFGAILGGIFSSFYK